MTRMRKRLLEDFLLPALNTEKYGAKLFWLDREKGTFRMLWSHKNATQWNKEDTIVFQDWDRLKGHYKPESSNYYMCSKQRFRAALYKLSKEVIHLKSSVKYHRDYRLTFNFLKKKSDNLEKPKVKAPKSSNESAIRESVIRENTSYQAKPAASEEDQRPMSPASPDFYTQNDLQILAEYSCYMEKMREKMRHYENSVQIEGPQKNPREVHESVLRENSSIPKIPHVAPQPVPVYCAYKQYNSRPHSQQEFPEVFVSKIYGGPENIPQKKDDTHGSDYTMDADVNSGILNLSLKSQACSNAPSR